MLLSYTGGVSLTYLSQILITNSDIIIVKHFFPAEIAGEYAALALIGRVIYFATWAITTTLFPIVAQRQQSGKPHRHLLGLGLAIVMILSIVTIFFAWSSPELIIITLFGEAFISIASLLWHYAVAAALYSLANVFVSYHLSLGDKAGGIFALIGGFAQVLVLWFWHGSLQQIVGLQIMVMSVLFILLIGLNFWRSRPKKSTQTPKFDSPVLNKITFGPALQKKG